MSVFTEVTDKNGRFTNPFLIYLYDDNKDFEMRFINDNENLRYDSKTWVAGTFRFRPNASILGFSGGGTLEIATQDNSAIELVDAKQKINLEVIEIIKYNGTVAELNPLQILKYGTVSAERGKLNFRYDADDRLNMTFPSLVWGNQNNRGNS